MRMNRLFALGAAMVVVLAACSSSGTSPSPSAAASAAPSAAASEAASAAPSSAAPSEAAKAEVRIGSDNFYESKLMAEMYAQVLENAGYTVDPPVRPRLAPDARPGLRAGPGRPGARVRRLRPRLLRQDPGHRRRRGQPDGPPGACTTKADNLATVLAITPGQDNNAAVVRTGHRDLAEPGQDERPGRRPGRAQVGPAARLRQATRCARARSRRTASSTRPSAQGARRVRRPDRPGPPGQGHRLRLAVLDPAGHRAVRLQGAR